MAFAGGIRRLAENEKKKLVAGRGRWLTMDHPARRPFLSSNIPVADKNRLCRSNFNFVGKKNKSNSTEMNKLLCKFVKIGREKQENEFVECGNAATASGYAFRGELPSGATYFGSGANAI